jgi:hypothetical protein
MKLWVYPIILFTISVLDLDSTCFGIQLGLVEEKNPIAVKILELGGISFLVIWKLSLTVFGISIFEFLWRKKKIPEEVAKYLYMTAIIAYVVLYTVITIMVNLI